MFTKGFTINGEHSYDDYGLYISKRTVGLPTKTSIRKTVPFMNGFYDFSRINGGDTWGERPLSYTFDIVCDTVEETDAEVTRILNWLGNIHEADIYDDTMPDYHFHGSFDSASQDESEDGEKVELTVTFVCYPFKIENERKVLSGYANGYGFYNGGLSFMGQPVRPTVNSVCPTSIYTVMTDKNGNRLGNASYFSIPAGETVAPFLLHENMIMGYSQTNELVQPWRDVSYTDNGITFTANADGSITMNGTATDTAWFRLTYGTDWVIPVGKHKLSGVPPELAGVRILLDVFRGDEFVAAYDNGNGVVFEIDEAVTNVRTAIRVNSGTVLNNAKITPVMYGQTETYWHSEVL